MFQSVVQTGLECGRRRRASVGKAVSGFELSRLSPRVALRSVTSILVTWIILFSPVCLSAQCLCGAFSSGPTAFVDKAEQLDLIALVETVALMHPEAPDLNASALFQIRAVYKGEPAISVNQLLILRPDSVPKIGQQFIAFGSQNWLTGQFDSFDISEPSDLRLAYCARLKELSVDRVRRLSFFLPHIESHDTLNSLDAFEAFERATLPEIEEVSPEYSRKNLRLWLRHPEISETRKSCYALMLGTCAQTVDGKLLDELIFDVVAPVPPNTEDPQLISPVEMVADFDDAPPVQEPPEENDEGVFPNVDRVNLFTGYLLARGEHALQRIEERIFRDRRGTPQDVTDALAALFSVQSFAVERISLDRIKHSVRGLLKRRDCRALAIKSLQRLNDWSARGEVMELYTLEDEMSQEVLGAVESYLNACPTKDPTIGQNRDESAISFQVNQILVYEKLLYHPEFAHTAVVELHAAGDWSVQDQIFLLYFMCAAEDQGLQQAIIRYLTECSKQARWLKSPSWQPLFSAERARLSVEFLRILSPVMVAKAQKSAI